MADEIGRRNAAALEQTLRDLTARVYAQDEVIAGLRATLGTMSTRMAAMEQTVLQQRAAAAGHGPTVK